MQLNNRKDWNISINEEREIWRNDILGILIPILDLCITCNKEHLNLTNKESIINPLIVNDHFINIGEKNILELEKYLSIITKLH